MFSCEIIGLNLATLFTPDVENIFYHKNVTRKFQNKKNANENRKYQMQLHFGDNESIQNNIRTEKEDIFVPICLCIISNQIFLSCSNNFAIHYISKFFLLPAMY